MNFALEAAEGTAADKSFLSTLWGMLSSRYAIGVYVIVILIVIIALIVLMISEENKLSELMSIKPRERAKIKIDVEANANISAEGGVVGRSEDGFFADGEEFEESGSRFYMLEKTDREMAKREEPVYDNDADLEKICEQFRNFAASRMGLYYDISDIRRFIAGMAVTHILIMQGMSGTGKTSLAYAFGEFLSNHSVIVPIQPMWKEKSDLMGYYNEFTKRFNETVLLQKMYEANYTDDMYITVLDEMNIARVEYYFAEFL